MLAKALLLCSIALPAQADYIRFDGKKIYECTASSAMSYDYGYSSDSNAIACWQAILDCNSKTIPFLECN